MPDDDAATNLHIQFWRLLPSKDHHVLAGCNGAEVLHVRWCCTKASNRVLSQRWFAEQKVARIDAAYLDLVVAGLGVKDVERGALNCDRGEVVIFMAVFDAELLNALRRKPAECNLDGDATVQFVLHLWACFTTKLSDADDCQLTGLLRDDVEICDISKLKWCAVLDVSVLAFIVSNGGDAVVDAVRFIDAEHPPS